VEKSGKEWKRVEKSGKEWKRVEKSGKEQKRAEKSGKEWKRAKSANSAKSERIVLGNLMLFTRVLFTFATYVEREDRRSREREQWKGAEKG
jgi:hypothetical protein